MAGPAAARPNGHDRHAPMPMPPRTAKAKARPRKPPAAEEAERKLLRAMRDNPGLSVIALANAAAAGRSVTGGRLRRLARDGIIEKDHAGRWRLAGGTIRRTLRRRRATDGGTPSRATRSKTSQSVGGLSRARAPAMDQADRKL